MKNGKTNSVKCSLSSFLPVSEDVHSEVSLRTFACDSSSLPTLSEARHVGLTMITFAGSPEDLALQILVYIHSRPQGWLFWKCREAPVSPVSLGVSHRGPSSLCRGAVPGGVKPHPRTGHGPSPPDVVPQAGVPDGVAAVREALSVARGWRCSGSTS